MHISISPSLYPSLSLSLSLSLLRFHSVISHQVIVVGVVVLAGAEASQALLIQEDTQGVAGGHQHIEAKVKLESIQDKWLIGKKKRA